MAKDDNTPSGMHKTEGSMGELANRGGEGGMPQGKVGNVGKDGSMGSGSDRKSSHGSRGADRY